MVLGRRLRRLGRRSLGQLTVPRATAAAAALVFLAVGGLMVLAANVAVAPSNADQTRADVPGRPAIVGVDEGDATLVAQFDPPGDTGSDPITTYQYSTDGGATWRTRDEGTTASPLTVTLTSTADEALVNGADYTLRLRAVSFAGTSPVSNEVTAAPGTVAGAPTAVAVGAATLALEVTWVAPTVDGGRPVTAYVATATPGGATCTTGGELGCAIEGLSSEQSYTVTVVATNAMGDGPASAPSEPLTPLPDAPVVPDAPAAPAATSGDEQIQVTWAAPASDGGSEITAYTVTARPGGATCATTGALTCTVVGLTNGEPYEFSVVATNVAGDGPPSPWSYPVKPLGEPGAPTALVGTSADGAVHLSWAPPADDGGYDIHEYEIEVFAADGGTPSGVSGSTTRWASVTSLTFTGLTNGTGYTFSVRAVAMDEHLDHVYGPWSERGPRLARHAFTDDGTFTVTSTDAGAQLDHLVVGGGGSGGGGLCDSHHTSGGGAGAVVTGSGAASVGSSGVSVGVGGADATVSVCNRTVSTPGNPGQASAFGSMTAAGGQGTPGSGGECICGGVSGSGNLGGLGEAKRGTVNPGGAGGGGQGGAGHDNDKTSLAAGAGGIGIDLGTLWGIDVGEAGWFGGGGGGSSNPLNGAPGGLGGGGNGNNYAGSNGKAVPSAGLPGTGGGGGAARAGGSGVVIVSYVEGTVTATGGTLLTPFVRAVVPGP